MAYNAQAPYEPPRRGYYGDAQQHQQQQQGRPVQHAYDSDTRPQYDSYHRQPAQPYNDRGFAPQKSQGYARQDGQGYQQQRDHDYAQSGDRAYVQRDEQRPVQQSSQGYAQQNGQRYEQPNGQLNTRQQEANAGYADRGGSYDNGSSNGQGAPNGYTEPSPPRQQRQYDARYQQRPAREQSQPYQNPAPQYQQSAPSAQFQPQSRPDPRNGRQYERDAPTQQPPQRAERSQPPPLTPNMAPQRHLAAPEPEQPPGRRSMDEWKSRERQRMHATDGDHSPVERSWDNAFPVFPRSPKKRDRSRPPTAPRSGDDASSQRQSIEQARPALSASVASGSRGPSPAAAQNQAYPPPDGIANARPTAPHDPFYDDQRRRQPEPAPPLQPAQQPQQYEASVQAPPPAMQSQPQPQPQYQSQPDQQQQSRQYRPQADQQQPYQVQAQPQPEPSSSAMYAQQTRQYQSPPQQQQQQQPPMTVPMQQPQLYQAPTAQQPQPIAQKSPLMAQQPQSLARQPQPTAQQPQPMAQQPPPVTRQPPLIAQQPPPMVQSQGQQPTQYQPEQQFSAAPSQQSQYQMPVDQSQRPYQSMPPQQPAAPVQQQVVYQPQPPPTAPVQQQVQYQPQRPSVGYGEDAQQRPYQPMSSNEPQNRNAPQQQPFQSQSAADTYAQSAPQQHLNVTQPPNDTYGQNYQNQWPAQNSSVPPDPQSARLYSPRQPAEVSPGHDPRDVQTSSGYSQPPQGREYGHSAYQQPPQENQQRPLPPGMQAIDTRIQQVPAYMDHQPLSPAYVPPRPSTASGTVGGPEALASPIDPYQPRPFPPAQPAYGDRQAHPQTAQAAFQPAPPQGYADMSQSYRNDGRAQAPVAYANPTSARSRQDEIEADMPDFDSAAPAQTSMFHKRTQPYEAQAAMVPATFASLPTPTTPTQPMSPQFDNAPSQAPYQRSAAVQPMNMAPQSQMRAPQRQQTGFADAYGEQSQSGYGQYGPGDDTYGQNPRLPQPNRGPPLQQQGPPSQQWEPQPFSPPFADDQRPRRSMDDARQMPYRPGPPQQQRSRPNGPPGGPMGPPRPPGQGRPPRPGGPPGPPGPQAPRQRRPEMDRSQSGPTRRPHHDVDRSESAPPMQQGMPRPPRDGADPRRDRQRPPMNAASMQQGPAQGQEQRTRTGPGGLPEHPPPIRPGLLDQGTSQPTKSPPPRTYNNASAQPLPPQQQQKAQAVDAPMQPVTVAELEKLRSAVDGKPDDNKKALLLVKKLAEASTVLASDGGRADRPTTSRNRERYVAEAYKRLKRLVSAGYPEAQFYLADSFGQGPLGLEANDKEAFNLYQAAAKAGHPQAAYRTAVCCEIGPAEGGGTRQDFSKAVQWYRRAAALNDTSGMYKLGIILLRGLLGQPKSIGEAVGWLKRASERADEDHPHALFELAQLYEPSNTNPEVRNKVVADEGHARDLYQRAAKLNHRGSQFRLGQAYEYGTLGLGLDHRASIAWYSKSAAQGDHEAELALAGWYLTGADGILDHSDTEAYLWARKAASSEPPLAKAMYAMGYFSETGIGCPINMDEAKRWYTRAASYRFPKAQERLEELRKNPSKGGSTRALAPTSGRPTRTNQKRDEAECAVM